MIRTQSKSKFDSLRAGVQVFTDSACREIIINDSPSKKKLIPINRPIIADELNGQLNRTIVPAKERAGRLVTIIETLYFS